MMIEEFEKLAMKAGHISQALFDSIERFYMSDNDYHRKHGGIEEDKQSFVNRVFGGKVNTPKSILWKLSAEASRENRDALQGLVGITEARLQEMDNHIFYHYSIEATINPFSHRS